MTASTIGGGPSTLRRVLIANRGEIAVRIARACQAENIECVALASPVDASSMPAQIADQLVTAGPGLPDNVYLSVPSVISAAMLTGCDAVHPGYGFLSESAALADECHRNGLTFVGPSSSAIRQGGDKVAARELAESLGIPVGSGSAALTSSASAAELADTLDYPVLLKAAAGGGGRGMTLVRHPGELAESFERAAREAQQAFGDGTLYVERFVDDGRHVEVQVLADSHGSVVHLGDRDCSYQRRYQKLLEEAPASGVSDILRAHLTEAAVKLIAALNYVGAATVEFLVDQRRDSFLFLEINTRVQVEHPVTEMVTGIDIVREQLRVAAGQPLSFAQRDVTVHGHAIECRINAEDPAIGFAPSPGVLHTWQFPTSPDVRLDSHCYPGYEIPPIYDSLLGKIIVCGQDRTEACRRLETVLAEATAEGISTTLPLHRAIARHPDFRANTINTNWLETVFLPSWHAPESATTA